MVVFFYCLHPGPATFLAAVATAGGVGALPGYIAGAVSGAVSNGAYDSAKKGAELIP